MKHSIVIRSRMDRLRYAVLFELLLISILAPLGAVVFERQVVEIGLLAAILCFKAVLVSLIYNWIFDLIDARAGRIPTQRKVVARVVHAVGLEVWLVLTSLPIVMWWLGLTIGQAILMDLSVSTFVVVYTFGFAWTYDRLFPVVQPAAY